MASGVTKVIISYLPKIYMKTCQRLWNIYIEQKKFIINYLRDSNLHFPSDKYVVVIFSCFNTSGIIIWYD